MRPDRDRRRHRCVVAGRAVSVEVAGIETIRVSRRGISRTIGSSSTVLRLPARSELRFTGIPRSEWCSAVTLMVLADRMPQRGGAIIDDLSSADPPDHGNDGRGPQLGALPNIWAAIRVARNGATRPGSLSRRINFVLIESLGRDRTGCRASFVISSSEMTSKLPKVCDP